MAAIITENQNNKPWTLTWKASGRYPIVADRIYNTLVDAQAYVDDLSATASATPGLVLTVVNDTNDNNGVYYVKQIAQVNSDGDTVPGVLVKTGSDSSELSSLQQDVTRLKEKVGEPSSEGKEAKGLFKEIDQIKSDITSIPKFAIQVVETLPTTNISNTTVYLVKDKSESGDLYTEHIYVDGAWENLGKQTVDLTGYAKSANVYSKTEADTTFVKYGGFVEYTNAEKAKLGTIQEGAQVNTIEKVEVKYSKTEQKELSIVGKSVTIDLSSYVKNDIEVNGKPLTESVVLGSTDIKLGQEISRVKADGITETVYTNDRTVHAVLADISSRIDNINAIVDGQIEGIASISAGDGIEVTNGETSTPTVSVKLASVSGLGANENGLFVKIAAGSAIQKTDNGLDIVWTELN